MVPHPSAPGNPIPAMRLDPCLLAALVPDSIVVADADGLITHWNAGAQALYGWSSDQAHGRPRDDLLNTRCSGPPAPAGAELLRTGNWHGEVVRVTSSGREVRVNVRLLAWASPAGSTQICEWSRSADDLSAVAALRQVQGEFSHAARVSALGELTASIAHEVNQPLAAIAAAANTGTGACFTVTLPLAPPG